MNAFGKELVKELRIVKGGGDFRRLNQMVHAGLMTGYAIP